MASLSSMSCILSEFRRTHCAAFGFNPGNRIIQEIEDEREMWTDFVSGTVRDGGNLATHVVDGKLSVTPDHDDCH